MLPLGTNLAGATGVNCTTSYRHMGSILDERSKQRDEILTRRNSARAAMLPLRRRFLTERSITLASRRAVVQAEGVSRQLYNAHVWHAGTGEEMGLLSSAYHNLAKMLLPVAAGPQLWG